MTEAAPTAPFQVLVVCTGNICRSPFAERMLRWALADLGFRTGRLDWAVRVDVTSAGLDAVVGAPMDDRMAAHLRARGIEAGGHVARAIDRDRIDAADLVLTATREHRRDVVRMLPRASRTVFALPEFLRLVADAEAAGTIDVAGVETAPELLRAAVDAAADRRGFAEAPEDPAADDVVDPFGRSDATYDRAVEHLVGVVDGILAVLERADARAAGDPA